MILLLTACSDADRERELVDLFATAAEDIVALQYPGSLETVVSANSTVVLTIEGVKSDGVSRVALGDEVEWSLSPGTASSIDQQGRLSAGAIAELVTVTARLGILSASIDIRVSTALFDQVVALNGVTEDVAMCRSRALQPVGRYVDEDGNEEIRSVDSTIIDTIDWIEVNAEDGLASQRAYIETLDSQPVLHTLAAGDQVIRARSVSLWQGVEVTSADFDLGVANRLTAIKLCASGEQDLVGCLVSSTRVEQDQTIALIAVGEYTAADGSSFYENITRNTKWGTSNFIAASRAFSVDRRQLIITGAVEDTITTLSAACGSIDQSLDGIDVSLGVIVDFPVGCGTDPDCASASATIAIDKLSVASLDVTANDTSLTDNVLLFLDSRPDEIVLAVTANFVNNTTAVITGDSELSYRILSTDGLPDIIEVKAGSPGVYTVLGAGTARIQLDYRGETFIAVIEIPIL